MHIPLLTYHALPGEEPPQELCPVPILDCFWPFSCDIYSLTSFRLLHLVTLLEGFTLALNLNWNPFLLTDIFHDPCWHSFFHPYKIRNDHLLQNLSCLHLMSEYSDWHQAGALDSVVLFLQTQAGNGGGSSIPSTHREVQEPGCQPHLFW